MKEMMDKVVITVLVRGSFGDRSVRQVLLLALFPQRRTPLGSPQGQHSPHQKRIEHVLELQQSLAH